MEDFGRELMALPMQLSLDADLGEGMFKGMASVFDTRIDTYVPTIIKHGAFKETLSKPRRTVRILWQHNDEEPIGTPIQMTETKDGLEVIGKLSDTQRGREALTLMRDGVITDLSIGFNATKFSFEEMDGDDDLVRIVQALDLWEFSPVTWGANPDAKITDVQRQTWERVLEQHRAEKKPEAPQAVDIGTLHYKIILEGVEPPDFDAVLAPITEAVTTLQDWEGSLTDEHVATLRDLQNALTKLVEDTQSDSQDAVNKNLAAIAEAETEVEAALIKGGN